MNGKFHVLYFLLNPEKGCEIVELQSFRNTLIIYSNFKPYNNLNANQIDKEQNSENEQTNQQLNTIVSPSSSNRRKNKVNLNITLNFFKFMRIVKTVEIPLHSESN